MPNNIVYIITSSDLVKAAQKLPTKLSFWFVEATFSTRMGGVSEKGVKLIQTNIHGQEAMPSMLMDNMKCIHEELKPSPRLDKLTRTSVQSFATSNEELEGAQAGVIWLHSWTATKMITSVTNGLYGPRNPFQVHEVAQAFREFENGAMLLLSLPILRRTCPRAYKGRETFVTAFEEYFASGATEAASDYIKAAAKVIDRYDISFNDKARFEISNAHAILANTVPTAFWTLYHIFSDRAVLAEVREAVMPLVSIRGTSEKHPVREIHIGTIREVPILRSVLYECLRHYATGTGARIAVEDTMLDGRYLLRKGSFVFMPNKCYHFNVSAWGPTVDEFDARRFCGPKGLQKPRHGAFRGFGGGVNKCPGWFFAMNEILSMCAMLAIRFDIEPISGVWKHPGVDEENMSFIVSPPKRDLSVKFSARQCWTHGSWAFKL